MPISARPSRLALHGEDYAIARKHGAPSKSPSSFSGENMSPCSSSSWSESDGSWLASPGIRPRKDSTTQPLCQLELWWLHFARYVQVQSSQITTNTNFPPEYVTSRITQASWYVRSARAAKQHLEARSCARLKRNRLKSGTDKPHLRDCKAVGRRMSSVSTFIILSSRSGSNRLLPRAEDQTAQHYSIQRPQLIKSQVNHRQKAT